MIIWKSSSIMMLSVILMSLMISRTLHAAANSALKISSLCFSVSFWLCHSSVFFCQTIPASFLLLSRHESSNQSTRSSWELSSTSKAFFQSWMRILPGKFFTFRIEIFSKSSEESENIFKKRVWERLLQTFFEKSYIYDLLTWKTMYSWCYIWLFCILFNWFLCLQHLS